MKPTHTSPNQQRGTPSVDAARLKEARNLLIAAVVAAVLIPLIPFILVSDKASVLELICFFVNFVAGLTGVSQATRALNIEAPGRYLFLAFAALPLFNIAVIVFLLAKSRQAISADGYRSSPPTAGRRVFGEELAPVHAPPSMTTINGIGFTLYGKSDYDSGTNSFMTTHYFVTLFVPLFPIARYRVISSDGRRYQFLGKGKLRGIDKLHITIFAGLVFYAIKTAGLR